MRVNFEDNGLKTHFGKRKINVIVYFEEDLDQNIEFFGDHDEDFAEILKIFMILKIPHR